MDPVQLVSLLILVSVGFGVFLGFMLGRDSGRMQVEERFLILLPGVNRDDTDGAP